MLCIFRVGQELQDLQPTWFMLWCPRKMVFIATFTSCINVEWALWVLGMVNFHQASKPPVLTSNLRELLLHWFSFSGKLGIVSHIFGV